MRRDEFLKLLFVTGVEGREEKLRLDAAALYGGFEATRVLMKDGALVVDRRNWRRGAAGVVTTDVLDLGGEGQATELRVAADGEGVEVKVRTGTTYFQAPGTWSEWTAVAGAVEPKGRYAQVRVTVASAVRALRLDWRVRDAAWPGEVAVVSEDVQKIVRSPVEFGYERPDQQDIAWLRERFGLEKVAAGQKTEFEQLRALMRWVVTRPNIRPRPWDAAQARYPWNVRQVLTERGEIYGHCMSYCEVMIAAAAALGWQGRHWAIHGVRDTSHEVPEIWVNSLGKWVYFDPSLDTWYADPESGTPLGLLEMHDRYLKTVLRPEEVQQRGRHVNEDRLRALRGKHPVRCVSGDYGYGKPWKWDWEWDHGYMSAGWLQLTPRNDWHSRPEPRFGHFGEGAEGFEGFPLYIDAQTPVMGKATLWYTRKRDLWWTLNQASFVLTRQAAALMGVECGSSQPFPRGYLARVDGSAWKPVEREFQWPLRAGENRLEVVSEDEYGRRGKGSSVVVRYKP